MPKILKSAIMQMISGKNVDFCSKHIVLVYYSEIGIIIPYIICPFEYRNFKNSCGISFLSNFLF